MKVIVDPDICEANAVCVGICPDVFRVEEDDTLTLLLEEIPEPLQEAVRQAERRCPRQALSIED